MRQLPQRRRTSAATYRRSAVAAFLVVAFLAGCQASNAHPRAAGEPSGAAPTAHTPARTPARTPAARSPMPATARHLLPGMPPPLDPRNVYAADTPGNLTPTARRAKPLVYVPDTLSDDVYVIDPATRRVVRHFPVGRLPQHVVPSYDGSRLWVTNDASNTLTPIDPTTGRPGRPVPVTDPYNLYFTPDGRYAVVVAERMRRLDFREPRSMRLVHSLEVPGCSGIDHLDFTADGRYLLASCEFAGDGGKPGRLLTVDVARQRVTGYVRLPSGTAPQDVKLSPDGKVFYVADMNANGVWLVTGTPPFRRIAFIRTGSGTHGLYASRDARSLYITNRGEGSVSVLDFATRRLVATWRIPGGGSPDMGNISADGKVLWLSGRWNNVVYALNTRNGRLIAKIPVGHGPHGLCVWPQPGRYSLGHTGIMR